MKNESLTAAKKQPARTIDCTPTWESLVPWFISVLEDDTATQESKTIIKQEVRHMAQVADKHVAQIKREKVTSDNLLEKIAEIARPKFCGDTNILLDAKVKIAGIKGDDSYLNGLAGKSTHPFSRGYNSTGMIGIRLFPNQKVPEFIQDNCLNIDASKIMFIE